MVKYQLAALALKVFSLNSITQSTYRKIGNTVGQSRRLAVPDLETRVERGELLVALAKKYGAVGDGSKVLEIGTGWMHWFSLYLRLFYKIEVTASDVWDNRQFLALKSAAAKLGGIFEKQGVDKQVLTNLNVVMESRDFNDLYRRFGMNYLLEPTGKLDALLENSFDLITSFHVMEHVSVDSVDKLVRSLSKVIKPGGYMIHQIGIDDHLAHYDKSVSRKQYIVYSENQWNRRFASSIGYVNRIQASEWRKIFDQAGFELQEEILETTDISGLKVGSRFDSYSRADLECTIQTLVYRRRYE